LVFAQSEEVFRGHEVASTADLDEARQAMERVYLPLRMAMTQRAAVLDMRLNAVRVGSLTAGYARFGSDVRIVTVEAEQYHVNIPLSGGTESRSGRKAPVQSTPQTAAVFMPDLPADISWRGDCAQLCVMFPRERLQLELQGLLGRPITRLIDFASSMDLTTPAGRNWMETIRLVDCESQRVGSLLDYPLAARHLEQVLLDGLLLGQPHNYSEALANPAPPAQSRLVQMAIELMHAHPERPWSPAELASAVAVSARSLQEGFQRSCGVPPMAYLRDIRLTRVHEDLARAEPGSLSVTQAATRCGFTHLGRFAAAYRRKFAESPSDTLNSTNADRWRHLPR
jgi:AraC-like DNA-binding protein